ncbi:MAG: hypothetical protein IH917_03295, partial [Acidobacteria bacterium]|nr:hypothetical protein [Acidobacteriota bacterium]
MLKRIRPSLLKYVILARPFSMDVKQLKEKLIAAQGAPEKLEVLDEIAACYYDQDEYQEAVVYYGEAEKLAPEGNPRAYFQGMEGIFH